MPRPGKRRNPKSRTHTWSDFSGGLNLKAGETRLASNEFGSCKNLVFERTSGRPRSLEPLTLVASAGSGTIRKIWKSRALDKLFVVSGASFKELNGSSLLTRGTITGTEPVDCCDWGDETDRRVYIAAGDQLQSYDGTTYSLIAPGDAPSASFLLVQSGRLLVARKGTDRLTWSGTGDASNWQDVDISLGDDEYDVHTDSDAQWLDVGYKIGGDISAITMAGRDLLVFRDDGRLFRVVGDYPDWRVIEVGQDVVPASVESIASIGTDVMYVDRDRGLCFVSSVETYGDMSVSTDIGDKVNGYLAAHVTADCKVWALLDRGEVWVRPNSSAEILVLSFLRKAWSRIDLGYTVEAVAEVDGTVYLAIGTNLYALSDSAVFPWLRPAFELHLSPLFPEDRMLVDRHDIRCDADAGTTARIDYGSTWGFPISDGRSLSRQILVLDEVRPVITATGGAIALTSVEIDVAEVI